MPHNDCSTPAPFAAQARQGKRPNGPPDRKGPERRGRPRFPFQVIQRVARKSGAGVPDDSEFFEVRCFDLSRTGFSFLLSNPPPFDAVVAALEGSSQVTYVAGEIVHCRKVTVYPSGQVSPLIEGDSPKPSRHAQGTPMVLVGVRFVERLPARSDA